MREPYLYLDENTVVELIEKLFSIKNFVLLILGFFQGLEKIPVSVDLIGSFYFEVNVVTALLLRLVCVCFYRREQDVELVPSFFCGRSGFGGDRGRVDGKRVCRHFPVSSDTLGVNSIKNNTGYAFSIYINKYCVIIVWTGIFLRWEDNRQFAETFAISRGQACVDMTTILLRSIVNIQFDSCFPSFLCASFFFSDMM